MPLRKTFLLSVAWGDSLMGLRNLHILTIYRETSQAKAANSGQRCDRLCFYE